MAEVQERRAVTRPVDGEYQTKEHEIVPVYHEARVMRIYFGGTVPNVTTLPFSRSTSTPLQARAFGLKRS